MRIAVGSDHAGYVLKSLLAARLTAAGHDVLDLGTDSAEVSVDYPLFGHAVGEAVAGGRAERGVCVCGTGMGIGIAANKVPGIRAAVAHDSTTARLARAHNDANVLCLGERTTGPAEAVDALDMFLATGFDGGRHQRRVDQIAGFEPTRPSGGIRPVSGPNTASPFDRWLAGDPEVGALLRAEAERQSTTLQLIASENFTSTAVLAATGSVLTNKYAEGYPGRRYYGGNRVIDEVEELARQRLTALFGAEHANVQPHAGSNANLAVYQALLEPGDTVLAMRLDHGGHLTHGSPASITSRVWRFVSYGVSPASDDPDKPGEIIDFDQVAELARAERPALIVAGSTAYPRIIDPLPFREIADSVGTRFLFDAAHPAGLIAGGVHPSPVGVADVVTLTTHKTLRGPRGGAILCSSDLAKRIDSAIFPGLQGGPLENVIAGKAVAFAEAARPEFRGYARQVVANAQALADAVAAEGIRLVSGGTENHQVLCDLRTFDAELTGKEAQEVLDRAGITCNRNTIPDDPRSPFVTSGLRLGTAAQTTAGMGPADMARIGALLGRTLRERSDESVVTAVRAEVRELCAAYPPYPDLAEA